MNRFKIILEKKRDLQKFEKIRTHLDKVSGFKKYNLVKSGIEENHTLCTSHRACESKQAFIEWANSDSFRLAHKNTAKHGDLYLGAPNFESFEVVL